MEKIAFLFLFASTSILQAQKNDNVWMLGYEANQDTTDSFCFNIIRFDSGNPQIEIRDDIPADFLGVNATYCNQEGMLNAYFDGKQIYNSNHEEMVNGYGINYNDIYSLCPQSAVMLDYPGSNEQKLVLFHSRSDYIGAPTYDIATSKLFFSIIDLNSNNGKGNVIEKNKIMINDTLTYGKVCAVRHGNGRDWWVFVNEYGTNRFYTILLDTTGPHLYKIQSIGPSIPSSLGQACFSPDGKTFATVGAVSETVGSFLELYDFDRCTGVLSNHRRHTWTGSSTGVGVAFSPNGRFLYVPAVLNIYQYDLNASDWIGSRQSVAIYDGYESPLPTRFFAAQLAPDQRIYISCLNGADVLHVINNPNALGYDCNVVQHGLNIGCYHYLTVPNYPNYRIYDIPNSPCDTLGINAPSSAVEDEVVSGDGRVKVYPNPVTDGKIWVSLSNSKDTIARLSLMGSVGSKIADFRVSEQGISSQEIQIPKLPTGIYYLQVITTQGGIYVAPIVIR
jgi:WD40 repeat protein